MIIAVDFDGVLQIGKEPNRQLIGRLKQEQLNGNTVILWTCREGKSLQEAVRFLHKQGFVPNGVNQNSPKAIRMLGHDSRKIYADIYIDDKAVRLLG